MSGLGRLVPRDWAHVDKYPAHRAALPPPPLVVETTMALNDTLRKFYDQGSTPQCVGYSQAIALSVYAGNIERFDARDIWHQAQLLEGINDPDDGAYVRDGFRTVMDRGPMELRPKKGIDAEDGPSAYFWCRSMDEVRQAFAAGRLVIFGINWYSSFDRPYKKGNEWWLPAIGGEIRGGHAICATRWSDKREAFRWTNSWGLGYPRVWVPVSVGERLLREQGEVGYGVPKVQG